ncbi:PREDICTED: uncharacterized protein LOC105367723 [Ceratosolen solmsi marchali]|uniref:Uncharacterized protein LOC105367723 n=1 Tax=Ceratosolen solmsi marchali TaxID=326594 RepID=A0AAJ6YUQ7_9HYME|nr:PREDICTED: uncharacterized protein LOC105367723 [Ceratosolen solmsi marchali]
MVVMHRELHLEEHHIRYIESNYNIDGDSVGFVLGQSITNQDYIFQFVKAGSICTNAGGDLVTSFNHVSYHAILTAAKDVYSGLPSGMTVLGIFTNGPGFCKLDRENEMKYLKIIEAINEALTSAAPNLLGCGNPEFLVLNCESCKNINCKSVDLRNKHPQEFSPVDVKIEKEPTKWYHMESAINLDYVIPLPYQDVREDTNLYLLNEFNNIMRSSIVLIDGELRPYFSKLKSIFKEDTFNETKYTDKNENDVKTIQCEIYSSYDLGSNEIDEILTLDYLVQLRGRLFSRAVCHESLSIQDVVHYIKYDYLRTLLTRIQAYQCILRNCNVEQIYANTEKNIALHQLPRRILIQLPPYKIPISLYVYPNDQFYKSIDMTDILLRLYKPSELVEVDMEQIIDTDESQLPWNQSQSKQNTVKAIHMDQCKQLIPSNQFILYTSGVIALIILIFAILLHQLYSEK